MNIIFQSILLAPVLSLGLVPLAQAQPVVADFSLAERGQNHRTWQRVVEEIRPDGAIVQRTNSYMFTLVVFLGRWHFKSHEFEVWQRKQSITEPFATGLFVRATNGGWHAFCLSIEDFYAPRINLTLDNPTVAVMRHGKVVGNYDIQNGTFRMIQHHENMVPERIEESPPGKWFKDATE